MSYTGNGSKGIYLDKNLLRSKNFRTLTKWSMLVYLDFLRKRQMVKTKKSGRDTIWSIGNNGEIVYPYSEAEYKGIGRRGQRPRVKLADQPVFAGSVHRVGPRHLACFPKPLWQSRRAQEYSPELPVAPAQPPSAAPALLRPLWTPRPLNTQGPHARRLGS